MVMPTTTRRLSTRDQIKRLQEIDSLRLQRPLTASESAEADQLTYNQYMRVWRSQQKELLGYSYDKHRMLRQPERETAV